MTYFGVLLIFVVIPIIIFAVLNYWCDQKNKPVPPTFRLVSPAFMLTLLVFVAVIYTTPWDNYLVATKVWWYDPKLVTGIVIGWVPIEEYSFFILQTIMTGLWVLLLVRYIRTDTPYTPRPALRLGAVLAVGMIWLWSVYILAIGWDAGNYLGLELVWALPPIILQLAVGADILWHHRKLVLSAIISATIYLCWVDSVGIGGGTWTINPELTTGLSIGVVPIEEILFFLLTNILLVSGLVLGLSIKTADRLPEYIKRKLLFYQG